MALVTARAIDDWYARAGRERAAWTSARDAAPDALGPREALACLEVASEVADATVTALAARDAETMVDAGFGDPGLPDLDLCARDAGRLPWPLPDDPARRARVLALYARPVDCIELSWLNQTAAADACYASLIAAAEETGFVPVRLALQIRRVARQVEMGPLPADARAAVDRLAEEAEAEGLDADLAALLLIAAASDLQTGDTARAGAALSRARGLIKRLGWPLSMHGELLQVERDAARAAGRWQEATRISQTSRDVVCAGLGDETAHCAWAHLLVAESLAEEGQFDAAQAAAETSVALYRSTLGPTHGEQVYAREFLGRLMLRLGRPADAEAWLAPIPALRARHPSERIAEVNLMLAWCALARGDTAAAKAAIAAADRIAPSGSVWPDVHSALLSGITGATATPGVDPLAGVGEVVARVSAPRYACTADVACPARYSCAQGTCAPVLPPTP